MSDFIGIICPSESQNGSLLFRRPDRTEMAGNQDKGIRLLRLDKLTPTEILQAAEALKRFVRNHRRRTHEWMMQALGLSKRRFYRFLAVGRWSKKAKELVLANSKPLSQTAIFRLADRSWKGARALLDSLNRLISHLSHRKRKTLDAVKKTVDQVSEYLKKKKSSATLNPTYKAVIKDLWSGDISIVKSQNPEALKRSLESNSHYTLQGLYKSRA